MRRYIAAVKMGVKCVVVVLLAKMKSLGRGVGTLAFGASLETGPDCPE